MPLPAGIATGLSSTAVNSNPPAGESILYCSRFCTSYPSISNVDYHIYRAKCSHIFFVLVLLEQSMVGLQDYCIIH